MKYSFLILICAGLGSFCFSQDNDETDDEKKPFTLHLGTNIYAGYIGGNVRGGGLGISPRLGIAYNQRMVFGIESLASYQIAYNRDSIAEQSIYLAKWVGPFARFYFLKYESDFNIFLNANYVRGSLYVNSYKELYRSGYSTAIVGLGVCYRWLGWYYELGFRYTGRNKSVPDLARQINLLSIGVTKNF